MGLPQYTPSMEATLRILQLDRRYNSHEAQARAFSGEGRAVGGLHGASGRTLGGGARATAGGPETGPVDLGFRL